MSSEKGKIKVIVVILVTQGRKKSKNIPAAFLVSPAPHDTLTNGNVQLYVRGFVIATGAQFILGMVNNVEFIQFLAKEKLVFLTDGAAGRDGICEATDIK